MSYLDAAATTPVRREVIEAMWPYLTGQFGNPSSSSGLGAAAATALAAGRSAVAEAFGCRAGDVVFTSGGSEANNLAVKGIALASPRGRHVVTSAIEHESVLEAVDYLVRLHGFTAAVLPVDGYGLVRAEVLAAELERAPATSLVSIMTASNEVGTVQPIGALAGVAAAHSAPFHTDAVQAGIAAPALGGGIEAVSISGHKLGAPKGVGALLVRGSLPLEPLVHGGGQERGRRSGTENVAGVVGLSAAIALAREDATAASDTTADRDFFVGEVLRGIPAARLTGHPVSRLPGHASFVIPPLGGELLLIELERRGVIASSGSACAAGRDEPSHVLLAMGVPAEIAASALRFTWSVGVTRAELARAAAALADAVATLVAG